MTGTRSAGDAGVALVAVGVVVLAACAAVPSAGGAVEGVAVPVPARVVRVIVSGDVLLHQSGWLVRGAAQAGGATGAGYDFTDVFADVAPLIRDADLAICHLETPLAGPDGPFAGYPSFDVQPQIVDALAGAGYDTCSTASNHSLDAGFDGLVRTLDTLDAGGIGHAGTFASAEGSRTPHIVEVQGVRVGHTSWTFGLNGIPEPAGRAWAVNDFDATVPELDAMLEDASLARRAGAELVIASVHCCTEYNSAPTEAQREIAAGLLASPDVDLVVGHHAHVVQPFERIDGEWVAYGLGNHVAEQKPQATRDSVIARFTFTRTADGRFSVTDAEAFPTRIVSGPAGLSVERTVPGDPAYERVAEVLRSRDAEAHGLVVAAG
ncbi:CapA family protein [Pseudonocardia nigra]|uniref:CapA family protein n=1 Tax=Pseudonocardia nigra TaxID=1921578 RepID=UPI001C5F6C59|nr:CapA family protein [Pseudonocardia nigra]